MKKRLLNFKTLLVLLLLTLVVALPFSSCSRQSESKSMTQDSVAPKEEYSGSTGFSYESTDQSAPYTVTKTDTGSDAKEKANSGGENAVNVTADQRKIIYSSNYDIQTTDFENSTKVLENLCEKYGAYVESSNSAGLRLDSSNTRRANYVIRVPVNNYKAFTGEAGTIGTIINSSDENTDVSEQYFDVEAHLSSAKLREERLLKILESAQKLDDVLALEKELANVRYEIESYTGKLRKWDSLISYSTVKIDIDEVVKVREAETLPKTLGERISSSLKNSWRSFTDNLEAFIVWLSYEAVFIVFFWIPFIAVIILIIILTSKRNRKRRQELQAKRTAQINQTSAPKKPGNDENKNE